MPTWVLPSPRTWLFRPPDYGSGYSCCSETSQTALRTLITVVATPHLRYLRLITLPDYDLLPHYLPDIPHPGCAA